MFHSAHTGLPPTVVLAEDHAVVRDGLKMLLLVLFGETRFLEADDAASLKKALATRPGPDLALIDLNMPGMDRGGSLYDIVQAHPAVPVVVVSAVTTADTVRRCLNLPSVYAFVSKCANAEQMGQAILAAQKGIRLGLVEPLKPTQQPNVSLSPRLEEVRNLVRKGMSNKAIAEQLGISEGTVKNYMSEMFKLLNVSNRTQAAGIDDGV